MPIYAQFTKLTEAGRTADRFGENSKKINSHSNNRLHEIGAKLIHQYALLGEWDFVNIVEAPDHETIIRLCVEINSQGLAKTVTMPATPIEELKAIVEAE